VEEGLVIIWVVSSVGDIVMIIANLGVVDCVVE
jgi:hypothetical protein